MSWWNPATWGIKASKGVINPHAETQELINELANDYNENDTFNQKLTPVDQLFPRIREALSLANLRDTSYSSAIGGLNIPSVNYDHGKYPQLHKIYTGQSSTDLQVGGLLMQPEIEILTGLVIGELPKVVAYERDASSGELKTNDKLTSFYNTYLQEEHARLYEGVKSCYLYGDVYFTLGFDRRVQIIAPYPAELTPSFNILTQAISQLVWTQTEKIKLDQEAIDLVITRTFNADEITLKVTREDKNGQKQELDNVQPIKIPNGYKRCPVFHLKNRPMPGYAFGTSEIMALLPIIAMINNVLIKAFESQQYHGKPALVITGIRSTVQQWLQRTFGVNTASADTAGTQTQMLNIFKQTGLFAFADDVKADFLESKRPVGAASEVNDLLMQKLVQISGIPDFMWGHSVQSNNSTVREQYTSLDAVLKLRKAALADTITNLLKYATWYFSNVTKSADSAQTLTKLDLVPAGYDFDNLIIKLIWPGMLTSDEKLKLDQLRLLTETGNISQPTLLANLPAIVSDPQNEVKLIKSQPIKDMNPATVTDSPDKNTTDQRTRDDKGNNGDNSGGSKG